MHFTITYTPDTQCEVIVENHVVRFRWSGCRQWKPLSMTSLANRKRIIREVCRRVLEVPHANTAHNF